MKLGLPAKLATFLLMASPFAYAEFECLPLAGTTEFMSTSGTGGCPQRSFKLVNGTQCEVVLHEPQCTGVEGEWFGTYRYTGSVFNENPTDPDDPSNPIPPDLSEIRQPREYTGAEAHNFSNAQYHSENSLFAAAGALLRNQNGIHGNMVNHLATHDQQVKSSLENTRSSVNSLASNVSTYFTRLDQTNADYFTKLDKINADFESALQQGTTKDDVNLILTAVQDVKSQVVNLLNNTDDPMTKEAKHNELLNAAYYSSGDIQDIKDITSEMRRKLETLSSGGSGGSGSDMSETNDLLDDIRMDAKSASISAEIQRQALSDQLNTVTNAMNNNAQSLSMQLGQQLNDIKTAIENGGGDDDTATNEKLDGLGQKLDGIKGSLDGLSDTSGFADDLAQGTAQGKSDLNQLLDGYDADKMLTDRFKAITDEAQKTLNDSGLSKFSDPSKFIDDSGMVKPDRFDDLVAFAQRQPCSPYQMTIRGNSYQMDLCPYAADASAILTYVFAVLTAIFCFVMISQTLINERLS